MSEPEADDDGGVHEAESKVTTTAVSVTASCIAICEVSADCNYLWLSPSFKAILGYEPAEMIGYSPFDLIHPDEREALQEVRYQSMVYDKIATLTYSRWKHKKGHYLLCAVGASIVCDKILGSFCIAVPEPKAKLRAATAQEVLEISPEAQDQFRKQKWYNSSPPRRTSDSFLVRADRERLRIPLKDLKPPSVRSFFLIDRFSQSENIFYISNNMLVKKPDEASH
ncbi:hypothetical protein FFLO_03261 [Filobasidium floriforme]|uniref:PAS domain-containing protein n=1 Tax=Filobasidium floriforme TaxID=5210 RepID=A0A8K0JL41_9TREE|nr:hypothetical protein FFLO_03261 [Filobasidium floriforme]